MVQLQDTEVMLAYPQTHNELMVLAWQMSGLLTSQKETSPYIMCFLMEKQSIITTM